MVRLVVNGEAREVEAEGSTPLLWVLRDLLGLTGTRYGCGIGLCGSCTVHVNGEPARSCSTLLSSVEGAEVVTIEGLDPEGAHPLQLAWQEHNVPQCGYCQAGQIMTAAALLRDNPNPSDDEIVQGMNGNLCRCGTYQRIRAAVRTAAEMGGEE